MKKLTQTQFNKIFGKKFEDEIATFYAPNAISQGYDSFESLFDYLEGNHSFEDVEFRLGQKTYQMSNAEFDEKSDIVDEAIVNFWTSGEGDEYLFRGWERATKGNPANLKANRKTHAPSKKQSFPSLNVRKMF